MCKSSIRCCGCCTIVFFTYVRLQTECSHYKKIAEQAYNQLQAIAERDILSQSQSVKLRDWLELMEEVCLCVFENYY